MFSFQADPRPSISCNPMYTSTQSCQNFARVSLNEINDQIRLELTASYTYDAMVGGILQLLTMVENMISKFKSYFKV